MSTMLQLYCSMKLKYIFNGKVAKLLIASCARECEEIQLKARNIVLFKVFIGVHNDNIGHLLGNGGLPICRTMDVNLKKI